MKEHEKEAEVPYIIIIEDNDADILLTREALKEVGKPVKAEFFNTGLKVLDWIKNSDLPAFIRPHFILLDINMPGIDGLELLKRIKTEPRLASIPVIVFSNSNSHRDVIQSYQNGANSFVKKPLDYDDFVILLAQITHYWTDIVIQVIAL